MFSLWAIPIYVAIAGAVVLGNVFARKRAGSQPRLVAVGALMCGVGTALFGLFFHVAYHSFEDGFNPLGGILFLAGLSLSVWGVARWRRLSARANGAGNDTNAPQ